MFKLSSANKCSKHNKDKMKRDGEEGSTSTDCNIGDDVKVPASVQHQPHTKRVGT